MQSRCSAGVKGVDLVRQMGDEGLTGQYACAGRAVKDTSTAAAINITESRIPPVLPLLPPAQKYTG